MGEEMSTKSDALREMKKLMCSQCLRRSSEFSRKLHAPTCFGKVGDMKTCGVLKNMLRMYLKLSAVLLGVFEPHLKRLDGVDKPPRHGRFTIMVTNGDRWENYASFLTQEEADKEMTSLAIQKTRALLFDNGLQVRQNFDGFFGKNKS